MQPFHLLSSALQFRAQPWLDLALHGAAAWWRDASAAWRRSRREAAERRELYALDDRTLRDIGLYRCEIDGWLADSDVDRRPHGRRLSRTAATASAAAPPGRRPR